MRSATTWSLGALISSWLEPMACNTHSASCPLPTCGRRFTTSARAGHFAQAAAADWAHCGSGDGFAEGPAPEIGPGNVLWASSPHKYVVCPQCGSSNLKNLAFFDWYNERMCFAVNCLEERVHIQSCAIR